MSALIVRQPVVRLQQQLLRLCAVLLLVMIPFQVPGLVRAQTDSPDEPFVRPSFAPLIADLRPQILAAAERHNNMQDTAMSDREFAAVIALILYNEHVGWAEELLPLLQLATPGYQDLQRIVNQSGVGTNFSIWPANLRPAVAAEIRRGEIPLADGSMLSFPQTIAGSRIEIAALRDESELYRQLSSDIADPQLAVEYLAANLARGARRARYEGISVNWRVLAAWHNRGLVDPAVFEQDPAAAHYLQRAAAYRELAERLVNQRSMVTVDAV